MQPEEFRYILYRAHLGPGVYDTNLTNAELKRLMVFAEKSNMSKAAVQRLRVYWSDGVVYERDGAGVHNVYDVKTTGLTEVPGTKLLKHVIRRSQIPFVAFPSSANALRKIEDVARVTFRAPELAIVVEISRIVGDSKSVHSGIVRNATIVASDPEESPGILERLKAIADALAP